MVSISIPLPANHASITSRGAVVSERWVGLLSVGNRSPFPSAYFAGNSAVIDVGFKSTGGVWLP